MMEIKERLALSARPGKLTLIRTGMFLKCYQQSLFSLVHSVYPDIKVTGRRIKKPGGGTSGGQSGIPILSEEECRFLDSWQPGLFPPSVDAGFIQERKGTIYKIHGQRKEKR